MDFVQDVNQRFYENQIGNRIAKIQRTGIFMIFLGMITTYAIS